MKTTGCYYMVLTVYIALWICQAITCHLTHSLIVLTDSYINLYKILDISLGILHLHAQHKARRHRQNAEPLVGKTAGGGGGGVRPVLRLFDTACTYQFKRLPVVGSFINGLFLAALLMSAAIEGIQTCFHASHSDPNGQSSILLEHPVTYPGILIGFALVGAMMQWCSIKVHEMRAEELNSASLLDLTEAAKRKCSSISELNVAQLVRKSSNGGGEIFLAPADFDQHQTDHPCLGSLSLNHSKSTDNKFVLNQPRPKSFESIPLDDDNDQFSRISLRSLKVVTDAFEASKQIDSSRQVESISKDLEAENSKSTTRRVSLCDRWWLKVRYCASPTALVACALIIYFIHEEMVTEIADATFAILVVVLLFTASYPPMKKAGKVLLQTAPDELDLDALKRSLKSISPLIIDVQELHVWSLTAKSNRIATCHLHLNKDKMESEEQLANLLREAKFKFLSHNIKCSTVQPIFAETAK